MDGIDLAREVKMRWPLLPVILTLAAVSKGKHLVLFTAEDRSGLMVGRRESIMQPAPHLGPLEIIDSDIAEGRFVGLLPHHPPLGTA